MRTRVRWEAAFAVFATLLLVTIVAPAKAWAGDWDSDVACTYIERSWDGSKVVSKTITRNPKECAWWTTSHMKLHDGWWYTRNIDVKASDRVEVDPGATVNLILWDDKVMEFEDGLHVPSNSTLNIYGGTQGTGKLKVGKSEADTAAIGGNDGENGGTINIYGGTIEVEGGSHSYDGGAGIGGGDGGNGGIVKIYGGSVTAKGGHDGAGIGGGDDGDGGTVEIYGGTVNATGWAGAGIGGGEYANGGNVNIHGGNVTATGGTDSAGIGGADHGSGGHVEIYGGVVKAYGANFGAGIGGGDADGEGKNGGYVYIGGGDVTAVGGSDSAGIGGGEGCAGGVVDIRGGKVTATGGSSSLDGGAGIGSGDKDGRNIGSGECWIRGGTVTAQGGPDGAGIGGGNEVDGGKVEIANGTVKATGGKYASGIGGGQNGSGGTVQISGGDVTATGGSDSAGIGGGERGHGAEVTISGGKVTAIGSPNNTAYEGGAGIGGGQNGDARKVNISGGTVIAKGGIDAAGIGGGDQGNGGEVNIAGGTVTATGGECAAGIGGGDADRHKDVYRGKGGTVTITGGIVTATGGEYAAGIGSSEEGIDGGTVVIGVKDSDEGPTVTATGGKFAAGIGGGDAYKATGNHSYYIEPKAADVTIYSGTVTATGGEDGAGIGGGEGCSNKTTKIYGGTVVATGGQGASYGDGGAGIGGGDDAYGEVGGSSGARHVTGGKIEIHGGTVTATGGPDGAGIGGGDFGSVDEVKIDGGTVKAYGGRYGAGIGGGHKRGGGKITITGGDIIATGGSHVTEQNGGAGIGGGCNIEETPQEAADDKGAPTGAGVGEDVISITGNSKVNAKGGASAAGIGGGVGGYVAGINIGVDENCEVEAKGGMHGAGIGGGKGDKDNPTISGVITISSGIISATGGKDGGAGIGTGAASGDPKHDINTIDVTISGGKVIANGGPMEKNDKYDCGAAIGTGGRYYKNDLEALFAKDNSLDDDDIDVHSIFRGSIKFEGGRVEAHAANVAEAISDELNGAMVVIGTSKEESLQGGTQHAEVEFSGATVYMYPSSTWFSGIYSQAVRGTSIKYDDDTKEYQHVWYQHQTVRHDTTSSEQRTPALQKYDASGKDTNYDLVVVEPGHQHNLTYTANGPIITATCSKSDCTLPDHKATLTIAKPLHEMYGDGKDANAVITDENNLQGNAQVVYYKADENNNKTGNALEGAPEGAGKYWAEITLGPDNNRVTAHVVYTIAKAPNPATVVTKAGVSKPGYIELTDYVNLNGAQGAVTYTLHEDSQAASQGTDPSIELDTNGNLRVYANYSETNTSELKPVKVNVAVAGDANYEALATKTITVEVINRKAMTVAASNVTATYGDTGKKVVASVFDPDTNQSPAPGDGALNYYAVSDQVTSYEDIIDTNKNKPCITVNSETGEITEIKRAGTAYVLITYWGNEGHETYGYTVIEVKVNPKDATIKARDVSISQGGTPTPTYEVTGVLEGDLEGANGIRSKISPAYKKYGATIYPETAPGGVYDIVPSCSDTSGNYNFTYKNGKLSIKQDSPVTTTSPATVAVGGATVDLSNYVQMNGAKGAVTYEIVNTTDKPNLGCVMGGGENNRSILTSGNTTGSVTVNVTVAADDNYEALTTKTITVDIVPKQAQTIVAPDINVTYGDTDAAVSASVVSPIEGAGGITYAVKEGSQSYIRVDPNTGALTIDSVPADNIAYVTATAAKTAEYGPATVDVMVHINRAPLIIKAIDQQRYIGGAVPSLDNPQINTHYTVDGFVNGEDRSVLTTPPTLAYMLNGEPAVPATTMVGSYDIVPSGANAGGNYAIEYQNGVFTVGEKGSQNIAASNITMAYGETGRNIGAVTNGEGALSYEVNGDAISVDESGDITTHKAGTAYVTITAAEDSAHATATKEIMVTVNRAQLTIKAKDEQIYAGETPKGLYDVEGLIGEDTLTTNPTITYQKDGKAVDPKTAPAGKYDIVPSDADSGGNYSISYVKGKLSIRADQTITASDVSATYGDTGKFVRATTNGDGQLSYAVKEGNEFVDINGATGELTIKRAGEAVVTVTAAETDLYAQATKDVRVTVAKRKATIQADDQTKWINELNLSTVTLTATVSGARTGDTLAYGLTCDFGQSAQVGTYPIQVTVNPNDVPNYNYDITTKSGKFTVTSTDISVTAKGWTGVYDGKAHGIEVNVAVPAGTEYTVAYGTTEGTYNYSESPTQTNAGSLTVYYQVTSGSDVVTGSKDVVVEKAPITPEVTIKDWKWGQKPNAPELTEESNPGNGKVTYGYVNQENWNWTDDPPTAYGKYTLLAYVDESPNYYDGLAMAEFNVTPVKGTLTFDLDGGTLVDKTGSYTGTYTITANCGDTIKLPDAPTKDGYKFRIWQGSEYHAGEEYKVEGDHKFKAVWEETNPSPGPESTNATLTFDPAGGTIDGKTDVKTQETKVGDTFKLLAAPTRDGYTFKSWKDSGGVEYPAGHEYSVTGNQTFTAVWVADSAETKNPGGSAGTTVQGGTAGTQNPGGTAGTTSTGGTSGTVITGGTTSKTSGTTLARTSDPTSMATVAVAACGAIATAFGLRRRR